MLNRLKRALVESFVGAIALGYVLAQIILRFVNIFASPIGVWIARDEYHRLAPQSSAATGFPYRNVLPELISFLLLLLVWFALLRWLYWKPLTLDRPQQDAHVTPMSPG
jgi:large-conductance mechanosensitive channel